MSIITVLLIVTSAVDSGDGHATTQQIYQLPAPQLGGLGATVRVGFMVHILALGKVTLKVVEFSLPFVIPPAFHSHTFIV